MRLCFWLPLVAADFCAHVELWEKLRLEVRQLVPRYSGRLNFVHLSADLVHVSRVQGLLQELQVPDALLQPEAPLPEGPWSFCLSGLLTSKLLFLMLGLTRETRFCGEASALVARDVMAAQWRQVLLSGWPVFQVFEVLSRWASPHLDVEAAETSLHGRAARGIARHMRSKCDEAEGGAMRAAREVLGPLWRAAEVQSREDLEEMLRDGMEAPSISLEGREVLCPMGRAVGLLATAWRSLSGGLEAYAAELVTQANLEMAAFGAYEEAGREAWASQWPVWQVLRQLQVRMDLLRDPVAGSPGTMVWPLLQQAVGFDDEAWRLLLTELATLQGVAPTALQRVKCISGPSCAAEFFGRLQRMLFLKGQLPLRDQIFMQREDALLPELMLRSGRADFDDVDYDWKAMVQEVTERIQSGEELSYDDELKSLVPSEHPLQVDRLQLAHFILQVRERIVAPGPMRRCLEWDQPFILLRAFAGYCRYMDLYSYSEPHETNPLMGLPGRKQFPSGTIHYWGEMEDAENFSVDSESMDLILCPFVFEHVAKPWKAMVTLAQALRPGGHVVWAAPMFQRWHGSPHDFYRYTPNGVRALAKEAGLEVEKVYAPGDLSLVNGVLMGMLSPYWSRDEVLQEAELVERDSSPRYPLNVFALLRKPGERPETW